MIYTQAIARAMREEDKTWKRIRKLAKKMAEVAGPVWQQGDGEGGAVLMVLKEEFHNAGLKCHVLR